MKCGERNINSVDPTRSRKIKGLAKIFKALSHPNRLELFLQILDSQRGGYEAERPCFVSELMSALNIGAPTVSHHLKELENAGLITTEKRGKRVIARLDGDNLTTLDEAARALSLRGDESP